MGLLEPEDHERGYAENDDSKYLDEHIFIRVTSFDLTGWEKPEEDAEKSREDPKPTDQGHSRKSSWNFKGTWRLFMGDL